MFQPSQALLKTPTGSDRLSALLDDILRHILLFLATKDVAATSILSTRRRNLFISVPDVDLDVGTLQLTEATDQNDIEWLIFAAISLVVQELEILMAIDQNVLYLFLPRVFTCKKIVTLKLNAEVVMIVPDSVSLLRLRVLHLQAFGLVGVSVRRLIQGCPLLEELYLFFRPFKNSDGINDKNSCDFES
ncbi:F-box/LRR-repeat protein At4g14103-like [Coffea eugenioides]|uniref:F-box/LRR-repeat protein At4g14103-like n=1 Tax=Coffea eugenioides TaxID=49369 RepID=UPI000F60D0B1|nr:F-box/LRR-repeat protein At4g14103-like [Coffea eugenioides]